MGIELFEPGELAWLYDLDPRDGFGEVLLVMVLEDNRCPNLRGNIPNLKACTIFQGAPYIWEIYIDPESRDLDPHAARISKMNFCPYEERKRKKESVLLDMAAR